MSEQKPNLEGKIPLEAVLVKFKENNKQFRENLEKEEKVERVETTESIKNDIKGVIADTDRKKLQFINEIKSGLGDKVKQNPGQVKVIEKKWYQKLGLFIKKLFTRF